jgi:hypothetical protein
MMAKQKETLIDVHLFQRAGKALDRVKEQAKGKETKPSTCPNSEPSTCPPAQPPNHPPVPLADPQIIPRTIHLSNPHNMHPPVQPPNHPSVQPPNHPSGTFNRENILDDPVWTLTDKQATVLAFMIGCNPPLTRKKDICQQTGISEGTVKDSLRKLIKTRFILETKQFRQGRFQGFSFIKNDELCGRFIQGRWPHLPSHPPAQPPNHPPAQPSNIKPSTCPTPGPSTSYISSSSFLKKPTTWLDEELVQNPELGYWRQKGLTSKQIQNWIDTTGCDPELMIQYLCYCRYEMVDLGLEESKPVNNVFNWFFKIIEKNCSYPQPKDYKSFQERQIEEKTRLLEKRKAEAEELKKVERALAEAEIEADFLEMMGAPDSDEYKQCFDSLSDFEKKRSLKGGKVFEAAMLRVFKALCC